MAQLDEDRTFLQQEIEKSANVVFFGGAGVSTESGIPDFRSTDGLYHQKYRFDPEVILSHAFYESHKEEFFRFYREKMLLLDARPNACHRALAALEKRGKVKAVVTQNIDGLHQKAGSRNVVELHGSIHRNFCEECGRRYDGSFVRETEELVPRCPHCGGVIKPDVVLYEEPLDQRVLEGAIARIRAADVLIVGGTSLNVYPAAGLIDFFEGDALVVVNRGAPARAVEGALYIDGKIGEVFSAL